MNPLPEQEAKEVKRNPFQVPGSDSESDDEESGASLLAQGGFI